MNKSTVDRRRWTQIISDFVPTSPCALSLRGYITALLAFTVLVTLLVSPADAKEPSAKDILRSASRNYDVIEDYTVDIKVSVESPNVHMPEMPATMYYKRPDKLHVESKDGFVMLPKQGVLIGNPLKPFLTGSDLAIVEPERVLDRDCYVIKGSFKKDDRTIESTVWIDKKDQLVRQMYINPGEGPSVKVKIWYTKADMRYWVPSSTAAQVSFPAYPGNKEQVRSQPTIVNMKFSNYRINTGLSDKLFKEKPRKMRRE